SPAARNCTLQPVAPGLAPGVQYRPIDSNVATARVPVEGRLEVGGGGGGVVPPPGVPPPSGGGGGGGVCPPAFWMLTLMTSLREAPLELNAVAVSLWVPFAN